jgi:hypothetical protein
MARYTETKKHRLFEKVPILDKKGKPTGLTVTMGRTEPLPVQPRIQEQLFIETKDRKKHALPLRTWVAPGQIINTYKELKRQRKLLAH